MKKKRRKGGGKWGQQMLKVCGLCLWALVFVALWPSIAMLRSSLRLRSAFPFRRTTLRWGTSAASDNHADLLQVKLPKNEDNPELFKIRHSTAHVMAMAVQKLYPKVKVTIGPCIENGNRALQVSYCYHLSSSPTLILTRLTDFYYDFHVPEDEQLSSTDLKRIKKEMDKIIRANLPITREEVSRETARARIEALNEPFKLEILDSIQTEPITLYHIADKWWDLCAGPHVERTGQLPSDGIELQSIAGAYWRGDEHKPRLQRIYGTAWENAFQLSAYQYQQAEAKRRDHRLIGKNMDLFSLQDDAGGGLVFWHPKGSLLRHTIESYWRTTHTQAGYAMVHTPHVANVKLWQTSGHSEFYQQDMFPPFGVEASERWQVKPMNCPFHCLLYKNTLRSYKELPIRYAELGTVYRYERSGTLHGLFRVRGFTQDDAHIFLTPQQLPDEITKICDLIEAILSRFGFQQYRVTLSTRPTQSIGEDALWDTATQALRAALQSKGWAYREDPGGGAFYGPKIDVHVEDALGRTWQCSTIQLDFNLPTRFGLTYVDAQGVRQVPIVLHRAVFGSVERFIGVLLEHTGGDLPLWLAPVQVRILSVRDDDDRDGGMNACCAALERKARERGLRVEWDRSGQRLAKQVRTAEQERVPLVVVIGEQEASGGTMTVRSRRAGGDLGTVDVDAGLAAICRAVADFRELAREDLLRGDVSGKEKERAGDV